MAKAALHPAWVWDCPECGEENFARATVYDVSDEEIQDMRDRLEMDDDESGFYQSCPIEVECYSCGEVFDANLDYPGFEDLDEGDEDLEG